MPKYYRFRATTPTRKPKRKERERAKAEPGKSWLDLSVSCTPAVFWYLRRTAWREPPPSAFPRLAAGLRSSLHLNNEPIFVFKIPTTDSLQTKHLSQCQSL